MQRMNDEVKSLEAGRYTLVARQLGTVFKGAVWAEKKIVFRCDDDSIDRVWKTLSDKLYEFLAGAAADRSPEGPTAEEARVAFLKIWNSVNDGQKAMLRAHLRAEGHRLTAGALARAAGYSHYGAANLHYGLLGVKLFAEMPEKLPTYRDGTPIMTFSIASGEVNDVPERGELWVWTMRPHIAAGLKASGLL